MRIKPSSYILIAVLLILGAVIIITSNFTHWEGALFPIIISSITFVLTAIELGRELRGRKLRAAPEGADAVLNPFAAFGQILGWILGFALGIYLFGFFVAVPVFLITYLKSRQRSWSMTLGMTIVTTLFVWIVFELLLNADLWKGLVFPQA